MFKVIIIMLVGVFVGAVFRSKEKFIVFTNKSIQTIIVVLLFFMGIAIGANKLIMSNLPSIGFNGLMLSLVAILGSAAFSALVYFFVFKYKK